MPYWLFSNIRQFSSSQDQIFSSISKKTSSAFSVSSDRQYPTGLKTKFEACSQLSIHRMRIATSMLGMQQHIESHLNKPAKARRMKINLIFSCGSIIWPRSRRISRFVLVTWFSDMHFIPAIRWSSAMNWIRWWTPYWVRFMKFNWILKRIYPTFWTFIPSNRNWIKTTMKRLSWTKQVLSLWTRNDCLQGQMSRESTPG